MSHAVEHRLDEQAKAARGLLEVLAERGEEDYAELAIDLVEGETGLFEALDAADREILGCEVIVAGCEDREEALRARRDRAAARIDKIRSAVEQALLIAEISEKIVRPTATFTLAKRSPALVVDDESQIPARFFVPQRPKLDKAALKTAAASEDIPGCHMTNGSVSLTIRRR